MDCTDKQIGRNIKAIRNANKKSTLDFAADICISESLLEKIENGTRHATDDIIQRISKNTGFSFNEIKHKDLSYLEKGELYFGDDLSLAEFLETNKFDTVFIDAMKIQFPIVEDEKALEDIEFNTGIQIVQKNIQSGVFSSKKFISAINCFIRAGKKQTCSDLSAINILSCFGYLYVATIISSVSEEKFQFLSKEKINSYWDYLNIVNATVDQSKIQRSKSDYLEKYNGYLTTYMRKLVKSKENSDYAYYFLCLRYWLGIMDERITMIDENQMRVFGESMFDSLWKMGNKYAKTLHDYLDD